LAFLGVSIYTLFFSPFLEITAINISGNKSIKEELILEKINPQISGKYLNYINKDNLLLIRTGKIKKDILESFKIIRSVETKRKFPSGLEVQIFEREPKLVFCGAGECFILDENEEAYDRYALNEEGGKNNFIVLTDESAKKINLGDFVLEKNYMEYILEIRDKLKEKTDLEIENNFMTPSLISKDIRVKTKEGWEIYFNQDISLEKEGEMLKAILDKKVEKDQRADLEYVDLRIDNKVFYKFKDGTASQIAKAKAEEALQNPASANAVAGKDKEKKKD